MSANAFRVIHVFPDSARLSSGPCNAILAFMESQRRHGMDIVAISPLDGEVPKAQRQPIEHLPIREMVFHSDGFVENALGLRAEGRASVYHFEGISQVTNRLGSSLRRAGIPYVFTSQGHLLCHGSVHWLKKFVYLNLVSPFIRNTAGLHFCTRRERERARRLLPRYRKPVLIHHNLVAVPDPGGVRPRPRCEFDLPEESFIFVYLGRLDVQHKGLDLIIQALARLPAKSNTYLVLVGPDWGGGRRQLEMLASRLGCAGRVRFAGPQLGEAKWSILRMADAFVSPSRWEACSSAQAEAIGFGLPSVISTTASIAPEAVQHGSALASPLKADALARAMQRLVEDCSLRRSLSDCGRKWIQETSSLDSAGPVFEDFYRKVIFGE